jgi:hypothetical protein
MKRKNIFHFKSGLFLLLLTLVGCVKDLDPLPTDKVLAQQLLNKQPAIAGFVSNCYQQLNNSFSGQSSGQLMDAYTDDGFRAGTVSDWQNGMLTPVNNLFANSIWTACWTGIRKCNVALIYLPQSKVDTILIGPNDLKRYVDEVKLIRAWYHFTLIKNFGPLPFIDQPFETDYSGWATLTRPTYDGISNRIAKECDDVIASAALPMKWLYATDFYRVNLAVAYALKSEVLLYNASLLNNQAADQAKWQKAADAAQACITALGATYSLTPMASYGNLFTQDVTVASSEVILRSNFNDAAVMNNNNGVDLKALGSATQAANCGTVPTQELVDCFEMTNGALPVASYNSDDHSTVSFSSTYNENAGSDPYAGRDLRLQSSVVFNKSTYGKYKGQLATGPDLFIYTYLGKTGTGFNINPSSQLINDVRQSSTGYYTKKYRSASYWGSTTGGTNSNKIYFRLAEFYLNQAEALCELNNLDGAIAALNVIRVRAGQPGLANVPGFVKTQDFVRQRIRNERRVELCFEDHRFYDQRRWKILSSTNGPISGMKITSSNGTDAGIFSYQRIAISTTRNASADKYLVLPVPDAEAQRLPGIGQLPFWK